jgi:protein phosphatase
MEIYGLSHGGLVRDTNEDRFLIRKLTETAFLLAVADGMGGQTGGEVAAQIVIDILTESGFATPYDEKPLSLLIRKANEAIHTEAARDNALQGMGTTATVALVDNAIVYWAHVGDSRLYHFRGGRLKQVTTDQNMAQVLIERGELTPAQSRLSSFRNILLQCVGGYDCVPAIGHFEVAKSDVLLLCTDGLFGELPHKRITSLLAARKSVKNNAESLIEAALQTGGADNIAVVLAKI